MDKEFRTFQCLNMFASAYALLDCWFLCMCAFLRLVSVVLCGEWEDIFSHKAREVLLSPCHKSAEVNFQSVLLGMISLNVDGYLYPPHAEGAHLILSCDCCVSKFLLPTLFFHHGEK